MQHRATVGIVFLIVFIDLVGFGIVIPILPLYADRFGPSPVMFGLFMASFSAMQFLFAPLLGRLSDRYGRRPVLLVSMVGSAVGYLMFGFAETLTVLFASRVIDGISGANISTAHAVIADITGEENRAHGMALIGVAFGLGFILGPAIGGLLVGIAPWLPGVAAATMSMVAFVLVLLVLPETVHRGEAAATRGIAALSPRQLAAIAAQPLVAVCLVAVFLKIFAFANFEATFAQFLTFRFEMTPRQVAFLFVYAGVLGAIVQGGAVRPLVKRFGEAPLVVVGLVLGTVGLALLPAAQTLPVLLAVLALLAAGVGIATPSLTAIVSKLARPGQVGIVMGVYQSMSSLGRIIGPFWGEVVYGSVGVAWPYVTGAVAMAGGGMVAAVLWVARAGRSTTDGTGTA